LPRLCRPSETDTQARLAINSQVKIRNFMGHLLGSPSPWDHPATLFGARLWSERGMRVDLKFYVASVAALPDFTSPVSGTNQAQSIKLNFLIHSRA
jgi:hypothetical protein